MSLDPTFLVTPKSPSYIGQGEGNDAFLNCFGADFFSGPPFDLATQSADDNLFFNFFFAADPALDYSLSDNLRKTRFISLTCNLTGFGPNKQLAAVFGFDALEEARLLVYSTGGQLDDVTLVHGDNQFLLEIESLSQPFTVNFVHARLPNSTAGSWLFKGITGYVV